MLLNQSKITISEQVSTGQVGLLKEYPFYVSLIEEGKEPGNVYQVGKSGDVLWFNMQQADLDDKLQEVKMNRLDEFLIFERWFDPTLHGRVERVGRFNHWLQYA